MKRTAAAFCIITILVVIPVASHGRRGYYGGYHHHSHSHYNHRYSHYRYHDYDYDDAWIGFLAGAVIGAVLVSAFTASSAPARHTAPQQARQPVVTSPPPGICYRDQRVSGEWRLNPYDNSRQWVEFAYPMWRRVQVSCY